MADDNQNAGAGEGAGAGDAAATAAAAASAAAEAAKGAGDGKGADAVGAGDATKAAADAAAKADTGKKDLGWGETWRKDYAGADEKLLKRLERYASPKAAIDALVAAQNKINSGELKAPLAENATPEQLTAWRKENGIPEKAEGYLENLPQGLVIGDDDKPIFETFVKGLHDMNIDPKVAQYAVKWYNEFQEKTATDRIAADESLKVTTEDELRSEWGNDYRTNINSIHGLLDGAPAGVKDAVLNARTADGTPLVGTSTVARWLVNVAREINPVHSIMPGSGGNVGKSVNDEIASIEKMMREDRPAYNKDDKVQARYRELIDARDKLQSRSAA